VLKKTAELLSRVGYAALRVEDVAALSGVNKTTIYRRWPTRADLVRAALAQAKGTSTPDTGSFEGDVLAWLAALRTFARSKLGAGIIRVVQAERSNPELEPIARSLRAEHRALRQGVVERAVLRGELPRSVDVELVTDLVFAPLSLRLVSYGEPVPDAYAKKLLRTVMAAVGKSKPARGRQS
jgi:AcrR family transcriptional regulator